jgi:hypothetical protein
MNDIILAGIVSGGFGLLGVVIGIWSTSAVAARNARIEERKHFRELGLKMALTKFEKNMELAQQLANATGKFQEVRPFEAFVIEGFKFMDIVSTPNLSASQMARRMADLRDFTMTVVNAAKKA